MIIEIAGELLKIEWRHYPNAGTDCIINRIPGLGHEGYQGKAWGDSRLHPSDFDKFNKETGRKISLARAMEGLGWDRETRTRVWKAYFARKG